MYEKFYGLNEKPFHIVPNPDFLYLTSKHQNALTYLEYGLMENTGFVLLTGEIGTGKTTLVRYILNKIESEMDVAVIFNTNVSAEQLLCLILQEFELTPEKDSKAGNLDKLYRFLIDNFTLGKRALLVIDEAQNLSDDALEEVRMLSNLQSDNQMLLQIMLVGQPELKFRLRQPGLAQLTQRIVVNYHLVGLSKAETEQYILYRIKKVGGKPDIFTHQAMEMIYRASAGIPRSINIICDTALVYGFADELETVDVSVVEQVLQDRGGKGQHRALEDESPLSIESGAGLDEAIHHRLQILENRVEKLQLQMEWQLDELEHRAAGFKDDLVKKLKELIIQERQRSDKLLSDYSKLKVKYHSMLRDSVKENKQEEQTEEKKIKSNLFKSFLNLLLLFG